MTRPGKRLCCFVLFLVWGSERASIGGVRFVRPSRPDAEEGREGRVYSFQPEIGSESLYQIQIELKSQRVDAEEATPHVVALDALAEHRIKEPVDGAVVSEAKVIKGWVSRDAQRRKLPFKGHVFLLRLSDRGRVLDVGNAEDVEGVKEGEVNWQGVFQQGQPIFPEEPIGPGSRWTVEQVVNLPESMYKGKILEAEYRIENFVLEEGARHLNIHVDYWVKRERDALAEAFKIGKGRMVCDAETGRLVRSEAWFSGHVSQFQETVERGELVVEEWVYLVEVYTSVGLAE